MSLIASPATAILLRREANCLNTVLPWVFFHPPKGDSKINLHWSSGLDFQIIQSCPWRYGWGGCKSKFHHSARISLAAGFSEARIAEHGGASHLPTYGKWGCCMISCHLTASAAGTTWCAILRCFPLLEFIKLSLPSILQEICLIELPTFFFFSPWIITLPLWWTHLTVLLLLSRSFWFKKPIFHLEKQPLKAKTKS